MSVVAVAVVAILQGVQQFLLGNCSLAPYSTLNMSPQNVLFEGSQGSFSLSAMYLQNRCQRNSGMLESWISFGRYAVQTNWAKVNCKSSLISASSQSVHRASITSPSASMNSLNQVGCLSEQTVHCCLPQRMHGVLAKPLPCLAPELPIMALTAGHVMRWKWRCSLAVDHNLL